MESSKVGRPGFGLKTVLGAALILAGLGIALFGVPPWPYQHDLSFKQVEELKPGDPGFPTLNASYPAESLRRYRVTQGETASLTLDVVRYRKDGDTRSAIIHLGDEPSSSAPNSKKIRQELWTSAMEAVNKHTDEKALFLSWWDDAQRIDFSTGRNTWTRVPTAAAFGGDPEKRLWEAVTGPYAADETRLRQLANWLAMDAGAALAEMAKALPADTPVYFLACLDDLARVSEVERLSGKKLGFEAALFPASGDMHGQIAAVKRWAGEKGSGNYLVQQIPGQGIRAWRITDAATENTLLAKLLPFTGSLANPVPGLETVYQSPWGGYLTIFQWQR
ncbi:hydroxylamine oxidation protein HaoB [Methylococcus sp. EFPC2]|uniref:hydroxylamine oxidation protein HaoB n=1 Tax=Methylococcus sp. EFPC2 TaxID=2812648 RepID=UPI0019682130|nr:hydroxylamine oxidation protein HaoB [Methylococcus sp. EFPC2]QSA95983.1 hydroxylamine oxidation protein HaoB [Methylococcus sp. EFPC2]